MRQAWHCKSCSRKGHVYGSDTMTRVEAQMWSLRQHKALDPGCSDPDIELGIKERLDKDTCTFYTIE